MNPPTTIETVHSIEAKYHIILPQEYVLFVTTVGNGGVLPDSSGLNQLSNYLYPIEQCIFEKAAVLFPYKEAWDWGHDDTYDSEADPEGKVAATQYGHFAFTAPDDGEGYTWNLIVSGPCRGEVWKFTDWKMCRGRSKYFLDWVLDCVEQGFQKKQYNDPEDKETNSLDERLEQIRKKLKRKKVTLNPVIPLEQLLEFEERFRFKFPKEYAKFLTKIGNGFESSDSSFNKFMFPLEHNDLEKISQPFYLEDIWSAVTNQPPNAETANLYNISNDVDKMLEKTACGYIILSTEKKRNLPIVQAFLLVVTGAKSGEIWCLSYNSVKGQGDYVPLGEASFIDWLDDYLNGFNF